MTITDTETESVRVTDDLEQHPITLRSPLEIIQHALNAKLAPAELREYFELYRSMKADEASQAYAEAMNTCQAEMPGIVRDKDNSRTGKKYASYEGLNEIIRPIYSKHGFSLSFGEEPLPVESGMLRIFCDVRHKAGHKERYQGDFPRDGKSAQQEKAIMTALQGTGSTYSYARRYLAKNIFNLAETDEDNDGNSANAYITQELSDYLGEQVRTHKIPLDRFLKWLGAEHLGAVTRAQFEKACANYRWPTERKNGKKAGS